MNPTLIKTFTAKILATRNAAHIAHWATKSYAQHVALDEFYGAILDKIDEIVEVYQGGYELIPLIGAAIAPVKDGPIIEHLSFELQWIRDNRSGICGDNAALCNLVDEMSAIYMRTLYKLRNLA